MKKLVSLMMAALVLSVSSLSFAAVSAAGFWKTIDDVTGKPKAIIEISELSGRYLQGRIIKIFPRPGYDQNELCTACKGNLHNQRIVGMTVLSGLKPDAATPGRWSQGEILDPHNGKTYHCTIQLTNNDQKLNVRGYIGMPLFGRSQVWIRANSPN